MVRQEIPSKRGIILKMPEALDLKNAVENVISSYETRIESVGAIFDTTHQILDDFQEAFFDNKEEGRKINTELRDILAHNEHLRRKDFDSMTQGILSAQEERETEVKNLLKGYLNQQREMARTLRENLAKFKDALAKGDVQRVKEFQKMIKEVLANQDARKEEVTSKLKEFQREQQEMAKGLKALLAKGRELRIKDLKEMLQEFRAQHKERLAHQIERRKEVNKMLGTFKQERKEAAKNWQALQKKMAQKRPMSPEAIHPVRKLQQNIGQASSCAINPNISRQKENNSLF
jgi:chromosome segregation ATPase